MGRITQNANFECQIGSAYHMCYYTPPSIQDIVAKNAKDTQGTTNGKVFPYIAHYLTTGDLIYPAHEGEVLISHLLEELDRLNLVPHLFQNASSGGEALNKNAKKSDHFDSSSKLRIRTRNERRDGVGRTLARILKLPNGKDNANPVYRPPLRNKGQTVVIVKSSLQGKAQIKVHGPSPLVEGVLPDAQPVNAPLAHHHLSTHLIPSNTSVHSIVMTLEGHGFVVTVRSSWSEGANGALITQWLLFRRGSNKSLSSLPLGSSKKSSSLSRIAAASRNKTDTNKKTQKSNENHIKPKEDKNKKPSLANSESAKKTPLGNLQNHTKKPPMVPRNKDKLPLGSQNQIKKPLLGNSHAQSKNPPYVSKVQITPDIPNDETNLKNKINKSTTLERSPSRWSSIGDNLSNSSVFSRSLISISGSCTLPHKRRTVTIQDTKPDAKQVKQKNSNSKEKEIKKPVAKWTKYSKISIKKVVGKLF